jgi:hypothetical protein
MITRPNITRYIARLISEDLILRLYAYEEARLSNMPADELADYDDDIVFAKRVQTAFAKVGELQ